jgi:hypothetical protein
MHIITSISSYAPAAPLPGSANTLALQPDWVREAEMWACGADNLRDLNGARIGDQLYTTTAALWIRGLFDIELDINLSTIE